MGIFCAAQADVIKIGAVLPLSGEYDWAGNAKKEGMTLCVEEHAHTKHTYAVIYEDGEFIPSRSFLAAKKLIDIDHVDIIVSMWTMEANAICPLAEQKHIVHFANTWNLEQVTKNHYTATLTSPSDDFADLQLRLFKRMGAHRIAVIQANLADWTPVVEHLRETIKKDPQMQLVAYVKFNAPVRDFRTLLTKINGQKPDALAIWAVLPESEIILRQAKELGLTCKLSGYLEDIHDRQRAEGIRFVCVNNMTPDFAERFEKRFHHKPVAISAIGYDQMEAIIKSCEGFDGKPSAQEFMTRMGKLQPWQGASGYITPGADRLLKIGDRMTEFKDGQIVPDPEFADLNKEMGW